MPLDPYGFVSPSPAYFERRECSSSNSFAGQLGLRISAVPVVFIASLVGVMFPLVSSRIKRLNMPPMVYFFAKYFGSGVIIGTAFVHLLYEAMQSLGDPCLPAAFHDFPYSIGIALVGIFFVFWIELVTRFTIRKRNGGKSIPHTHGPVGLATKGHDLHATSSHRHSLENGNERVAVSSVQPVQPAQLRQRSQTSATPDGTCVETAEDDGNSTKQQVTEICDDTSSDTSDRLQHENIVLCVTTPPTCPDVDSQGPLAIDSRVSDQDRPKTPAEKSLDMANLEQMIDTDTLMKLHRTATANAEARLSAQIATICLLEFGIVFHSVFVGLTLAVAGQSFPTLYVVICFHQMFEGMGLGSRLAETPWGKKNEWVPWFFAIAFAITTPLGIAVGLGVRNSYPPGSARALITNGVFDSISAGILIYTSLVELMGAEFLYSDEFDDASFTTIMLAFGFMCLGCGLMSMLGRWA